MPPPISFIKETCLYMEDLETCKQFYHQILGLPIISDVKGKHIFFRAGSSVLLCFNPKDSQVKTELPPHYGSGHLHFAFEAPSNAYNDWKEHIKNQGIIIEQEVDWGKERYSFYFRDPFENAVEIVMPGIWDTNN